MAAVKLLHRYFRFSSRTPSVIISAMKRPDEAYLQKKPMSRIAHGILFLLLSAAATSAVGGILFAILAGLAGFY